MTTTAHPQNRRMYRLFAVLTLVLIMLLILHARRTRRPGITTVIHPPSETRAVLLPAGEEQESQRPVALDDIPAEEARNLARRPGKTPGSLDVPTEARQALQMQTQQLLAELRDQPSDPNQKRALSISKEDIQQLEKEGRLIF